MKTTTKRTRKTRVFQSTILALALVFDLFAAMPITASAASSNDTINIGEGWLGNSDQMFADWTYNASTHAMQVGSNSTVTVVGSATAVENNLRLTIGPGATVIWKAAYSGDEDQLIQLFGSGTFEVAAGGSIINDEDSGNCAIYISALVSAANVNIIISGGTVSAEWNAIYSRGRNTTITVNSGTVGAKFNAISADGNNANITVNGGTVNSAYAAAIVTGGDNASITVNGGFVFGYGTVIASNTSISSSVIYMERGSPTIGGTAVVCAWEKPGETLTYAEGSTTDLTVAPDDATATWGKNGAQNGINYSNGSNTGFFPVSTTYTVTFNSNSGSAVTSQSVNSGGTATKPTPDPIRAGYTFGGWYSDAALTTEYVFTTPVTANITLYAKWAQAAAIPPGSGSMSNFHRTRAYIPGMFSDVVESMWYGYNGDKSVANAYEYNLMSGYPDATFRPAGNMTLAEAITIAVRIHSIYYGGTGEFTLGTVWYQVYVDYAINNDIIGAIDFTDYNKAATRAQMAYIFSRSLPVMEFASQNIVNTLPDVNSGTPYYDAILMMYKAGVVGGEGTNAFRPGDNVSRAEAAAIITRVILPASRFSGRVYG